jgi:LysM repeat protein
MPHRLPPARTLLLAIILLILLPGPVASAQSGGAQDVINAVNALRASYGLRAYAVDGGLMAASQNHSNYQASIQLATHIHKDGSNPNLNGLRENVAVTSGFNLDYVMNTIWSDEIHMTTMVGYQSGAIGAGVASAADGEMYYTIDVRPGGAVALPPAKNPAVNHPGMGVLTPFATSPPIAPVLTATPRANGFLVHVVGYGQTLWDIAIAYGVRIDDLRALNSMADGSVDIYTGQKLLVRVPRPSTATAAVQTMTAAPEATLTAGAGPEVALMPTQISTLTRTPRPPTATPQPTLSPTRVSTPTPESAPADNPFDNARGLGAGLMVVCGIGLAVVAFSGWKKR